MKKILFTIVFLLTFVVIFATPLKATEANTEVAKIGDNSYNSLYEAVQNAQSGDVIEILKDSEESNNVVIDKKLTIIGNGHELKYTTLGNEGSAIIVKTSESVEIDAIKIVTLQRGIEINQSEVNFALKNSTISVAKRGISVASDANTNSKISIENSIIENNKASNYDEEVIASDTRGISLWDYTNSNINMKNSTIQGFSYAINIGGQGYNSENTQIRIDNCKIKARAALNIWASNLNIKVIDSYFLGINNFSGPTESFANIVLNNTCNDCNIDITSTQFSNYQNTVGINNPNALQYMLATRGKNNYIGISGNTKFIDSTGKIEDINEQKSENNNIKITGGIYSLDITSYLEQGYTVVERNGNFVVGLKATNLKVDEELNLIAGNKYSLNFEVEPTNTIENVKFETNSEDIVSVDENGKVKANKVGEAIIKITVGDIAKECKIKVLPKEIKQETAQIDSSKAELQLGVAKEDQEKVNRVILKSLENQEIYNKVKEYTESGKEVTTNIEINKIKENNMTQEEKNKIEEVTKDKLNIAEIFDINILVKSENEEIAKIQELPENITLSILLADDLIKENRTFYILRIHDGQVDKIETELTENILKFNTNKFSKYLLAYEDVETGKQEETSTPVDKNETKTEPESKGNNETSNEATEKKETLSDKLSPQTGDFAIIILMIIALISFIGIIKLRKRKASKH